MAIGCPSNLWRGAAPEPPVASAREIRRDALLQDANKYLVLCEPSQSAHNPFPAVTTLLKKVKQ